MAREVWLIVNRASGSNDEATLEALRAALDRADLAPARTLSVPDDPLPDRHALEAAGVELLVLFAGDGTANAALLPLDGWGGEALVLPGGTQNLLARALHGELSAEAIVGAFAELVPTRRHRVRSRHGDGLCEIVAGPGATWSEVREALREGTIGELAAATSEAVAQTSSGPMVSLADPPLGKPEGYPAVRLHPAGDAIAVDAYGAESLADYARQGLAILQRDFRQGPHDTLGRHRTVLCRSDAAIELMIDGERATGGREERFTIAPFGVTLLAHPDRDRA